MWWIGDEVGCCCGNIWFWRPWIYLILMLCPVVIVVWYYLIVLVNIVYWICYMLSIWLLYPYYRSGTVSVWHCGRDLVVSIIGVVFCPGILYGKSSCIYCYYLTAYRSILRSSLPPSSLCNSFYVCRNHMMLSVPMVKTYAALLCLAMLTLCPVWANLRLLRVLAALVNLSRLTPWVGLTRLCRGMRRLKVVTRLYR